MAAITFDITGGEQSVTTAGAIGSGISTASMTGAMGRICVRVHGLASGNTCKIAIEDTNNASAFSDAVTVFTVDENGTGTVPEGIIDGKMIYQLPSLRYGSTNTKLRANVLAISGGTAKVQAWVEQ